MTHEPRNGRETVYSYERIRPIPLLISHSPHAETSGRSKGEDDRPATDGHQVHRARRID
jgi:hypothetical protein